MNRSRTQPVTLAQWLAVLMVWGMVVYGAFAPSQAVRPERIHQIACK